MSNVALFAHRRVTLFSAALDTDFEKPGRCPNGFSLHLPPAAVVAVAPPQNKKTHPVLRLDVFLCRWWGSNKLPDIFKIKSLKSFLKNHSICVIFCAFIETLYHF